MDGMDFCEECEKEHREEVKELREQLKAKEQECETLASQLDFEVQKKECLEQECELWKMRYEELKKQSVRLEAHLATLEANIEVDKAQYKELQSKNEKLKQYKEVVDKLAGMQIILTNEEKMPMLYENAKDLKLKQLSKTLIDIKEIAENGKRFAERYMITGEQKANVLTYANAILQKISEVIPNEN